MKTSKRGIDLIKKYEGFRNTAYLCPAGVWTIGWGSTIIKKMKVKKRDGSAFYNNRPLYQLEQKSNTTYVSQKVLGYIEKSLITFDYSTKNINDFDNKYKKKILYFPMPIVNTLDTEIYERKYDILFYGNINIRRTKIIERLKVTAPHSPHKLQTSPRLISNLKKINNN